MRPIVTEDVKAEGSLGGQKILMQLNPAATKHLIGVLTDLYSDAEKAVIREYSTNAHDSHIEAGQTRPIQVSTPNVLDPNFRVKDFGIGLSVNEVAESFQYGTSTKRETDTQNGILGLGCKSALTLVSQFFVHSVKNGVKVQASVYRDEDGQSIVEIVDTRATDEPNGVEIVIPVRPTATFTTKVNEFFKYWKPGTVLVDGKPPKTPESVTVVHDQLWLEVAGGRYENAAPDLIVMGNVAYPVDKDKVQYIRSQRFHRNVRAIHFVEIGDVAFVPSREALYYSDLTKTTLARIYKEASDSIVNFAQADIAKQTTAAEAVNCMMGWSERIVFPTVGFKWNDLVMETNWRDKHQVFRADRARNQVQSGEFIELRQLQSSSALVITNWGVGQVNKRQKDKMRQYSSMNQLGASVFYLFPATIPGSPWTDDVQTVDWAIINKVTLPKRVSYGTGGGDGGYETLQAGWKSSVHEFKQKNLCWARRAEYLDKTTMSALFPDTDFVVLSENRIDKFNRLHPRAKHLSDFVVDEYIRQVKGLTQIQKQHRGMNYRSGRDVSFFSVFDADRIDDPKFAELVGIAKAQDNTAIDRLARMMYATPSVQNLEHRVTPPSYDWRVVYPLLNDRLYGTSYMDDIYLYMNAKYAQLQEAKS